MDYSVLSFPRTVFNADHQMFRQTVRRFLQDTCHPRQQAWEQAGVVDRQTWRAAGEAGLLCTGIDTAYGGSGADFGFAAVMQEEIAYTCLSGLGFSLHSDIIAPYIQRLGSETQKKAWLPKAASGETILAIAMSEPGAGSDLKAIRTTAIKTGNEYVLNGAKTFISNALSCDLIVVAAKTQPELGSRGVSLLVVEADRMGVKKGKKLAKMGQEAADTAELFFDDVHVPAGNLLGEENRGFGYLMQELAQERFLIAIAAAAKLEAMLLETVRYTKARMVYGSPLFDMQNTRFTLSEIKTRATAVRMMVDQYLEQHLARRLTLQEAAMVKLFSTETLTQCLDQLLQLYGGYGYMMEYSIARAYVDTRVYRIYGGTSEVMKELISRGL